MLGGRRKLLLHSAAPRAPWSLAPSECLLNSVLIQDRDSPTLGSQGFQSTNKRMLLHVLGGTSVKNTSDGWLLFFNCCFKISMPPWDVFWCLESRKTPKSVISWRCVPLKARAVPGRDAWAAQAPVPCCVGQPARPRGVGNTSRAAARITSNKESKLETAPPEPAFQRWPKPIPSGNGLLLSYVPPQAHHSINVPAELLRGPQFHRGREQA